MFTYLSLCFSVYLFVFPLVCLFVEPTFDCFFFFQMFVCLFCSAVIFCVCTVRTCCNSILICRFEEQPIIHLFLKNVGNRRSQESNRILNEIPFNRRVSWSDSHAHFFSFPNRVSSSHRNANVKKCCQNVNNLSIFYTFLLLAIKY